MNFLTEMFEGAYEILFPRKKIARKYNRNRLGRFSVNNMTFRTYQDLRRSVGIYE